MADQELTYFAYLLRIWRANDDDEPVWRASLQRPGEEEQRGFASLDELFAFLCGQIGVAATGPGGERVEEEAGECPGQTSSREGSRS